MSNNTTDGTGGYVADLANFFKSRLDIDELPYLELPNFI